MNKSVSATDLAKMLYCEASVTQKASFTSLDVLRMNKGKNEHKRFEQTLRTLRESDDAKESSLPNIKVSPPPARAMVKSGVQPFRRYPVIDRRLLVRHPRISL
ncbi:MAG: hypothetical protein JAY72_02195, partial [Candidatus Thiodiazotropha endolucinida]|nr:hypothetical protein [Candidatus Thiodiazotropha taylori]MCW4320465.1 hypothetical protein [Candidatus Thiodiazotropha taylori]